tara:strand:+ start:170 stop:772 length:603 start_codon:yes stop_codon:yes gene_type:complete
MELAVLKPKPILLIIDNFYSNPLETRKYILEQEFKIRGNYPGQRTLSYASEEIKSIIQEWIYPFGGKITDFPMNKSENNYNGAFQYTTSRDRSWIHVDSWNNWAGVLYMTPDAPVNSGTGLYRFKDGTRFDDEQKLKGNNDEISNASQDITKWELVDKVGNIFNRLVIFNSKSFHMSMDYFGNDKYTGRLFQVFFFSTEK